MKFAWVLGCVLASIATVILLFALVFFGWLALFPEQANSLELGVIAILLSIPIFGTVVGIVVGIVCSCLLRPRAVAAGIPFILFALPPAALSTWFFANSWHGTWEQISNNGLSAFFFLTPVVLALGLIGCGLTILLQRRRYS